jgi:hypothetical protein
MIELSGGHPLPCRVAGKARPQRFVAETNSSKLRFDFFRRHHFPEPIGH